MENKKSKKKLSKKSLIILIIVIVLLIACGIGGFLLWKNKQTTNNANNTNELSDRNATETLISETANNGVLAEGVWYNDYDNSALVFADTEHFVWYSDNDYANSQNYIAGLYEYYDGTEAYNLISSLYSEDEEMPEDIGDTSILVLYIATTVTDGVQTNLEEVTTKYLLGFYSESVMSYIDMETLAQYDFYSNINDTNASRNLISETEETPSEVKLTDTYKDLVYADDTSAWQSFEIKFNGKSLSYPWASKEMEDENWTCGAADEDSGLASFVNNTTGGRFDVRFANKVDDSIKMINANANGGTAPELILPNGITWYSTLEEVLSAYGEPTSNDTDDSGANILVYEYDNLTMTLTIMGENTYSNAGLTNIYLNGK